MDGAGAGVDDAGAVEDVDGESGACGDAGVEGPVGEGVVDEGVGVVAAYVVAESGLEVVADVVVGAGALELEDGEVGGGVVDGVRPGVAGEELEAVGELALELDLQRVVVGAGGVGGDVEAGASAEVFVGRGEILGIVQELGEQTAAGGGYVVDGEGLLGAE